MYTIYTFMTEDKYIPLHVEHLVLLKSFPISYYHISMAFPPGPAIHLDIKFYYTLQGLWAGQDSSHWMAVSQGVKNITVPSTSEGNRGGSGETGLPNRKIHFSTSFALEQDLCVYLEFFSREICIRWCPFHCEHWFIGTLLTQHCCLTYYVSYS